MQSYPSTPAPTLSTLQLGMGWLPEESGGLNRMYFNCIRHLPQAGVSVRGIVAGSSQVAQASQGIVQGFAPAGCTLWHRWFRLRHSVNQVLKETQPELIASHFALYTLPVLDLIGDRPLVVHFHGPWALESNFEDARRLKYHLKHLIEQTVYRKATNFIVLSQAFRDILHQTYQVPLEQIHVVPGGVDIDHFDLPLSRITAREQLGWAGDRPILFTVRRLTRRMGLENLVTAMDKVRRHNPDVLLLIAGQGELELALQTHIKNLELQDQVHLLGHLSEQQLALAYRAANFSVVPTVALEGFGLVVIESLAAGTPVLGTPIGGIPEILRPLSNDLVFEGETSDHLAWGILQALSGTRHLPTQADCQAYVRKHYGWSVVAQQLQSVYQTVLHGKF